MTNSKIIRRCTFNHDL